MASLSARAAPAFPSAVRDRGAAYARGSHVRLTRASPDAVEATVVGAEAYRVRLEADEGQLFASCTCPYVDQYDAPCKHIWATLLAAEARGALGRLARETGPLSIELEPYDDDEFDGADDDDEDDYGGPRAVASFAALGYPSAPDAPSAGRAGAAGRGAPPRAWREVVAAVAAKGRGAPGGAAPHLPGAAREIAYVVDVAKSLAADGLALEIVERSPRRGGQPGAWKALTLRSTREVAALAEPSDRRLLSFLTGIERPQNAYDYGYGYGYGYEPTLPSRFVARALAADALLPELCATGRLFVRDPDEPPPQGTPAAGPPGQPGAPAAGPRGQPGAPAAGAPKPRGASTKDPPGPPIAWDDGPPWGLRLRITEARQGAQVELRGVLERGEQRAELGDARLLLGGPGGVVIFGDRAARFDDRGAGAWVAALRAHGPLRAPRREQDKLVEAVLGAPAAPPIDLPEGALDEVRAPLAPSVSVRAQRPTYAPAGTAPRLYGEVRFAYDGAGVPSAHPGAFVPDLPRRRLLVRDAEAERAALEQLVRAGFGPARTYGAPEGTFEIAPKDLPAAVRALTEAGWRVEAEGKLYRRPGEFTLHADKATGVDWFELRGGIDFGGQRASLPALLAALDRDDRTVVLGDGSLGLLPEAWLKQWAPVLRFGEAKGEAVAYRASQAGLLDALLMAAQEGAGEATIARVRERLPRFSAATEAPAPPGFVGELRPYQRQGLGWLLFLERAGLGGCLADDMGLGKTVQVLALLERQRTRRPRRPSLVVVPRSLLFNWQGEAARFAPKLKVLAHIGTGRSTAEDHLGRFDVVLTTYGTLRRDAAALARQAFRYVVLDEAQAIKNADSDASKAARLIRADHRLALSGTPVENHLGELWSLFEFLNPGMLGRASVFRGLVKDARVLDEGARPLVRSLIRPVLLRRTKAEVERDLPAKVEETVACELGPRERREYDALREHFRRALLDRVAREGMARAKIHVLEALLRLRQAACHPGLLDPKRRGEPSAKVDELLERLATVVDEGHKALVFSQFTSLLAIVRARLDAAGVAYAYLDGKTRDREARVERFQTDPACPVFLVSLKAGGVGLNLTAAEYVFLLDPWWNPAVEAQAIDRSHRIGQTHPVFAYRLLARGTVEEKVAELQAQKRALADAILGGDSSPLGELTREDLERLLS